MVTKSRSGKTTTLSGNVGTAAAASPGMNSDEPTRPVATSPATTARRLRPGARSGGGGPVVTPAVTPVRLGIFIWRSCLFLYVRPPLWRGPFGYDHGPLYCGFAISRAMGETAPPIRGEDTERARRGVRRALSRSGRTYDTGNGPATVPLLVRTQTWFALDGTAVRTRASNTEPVAGGTAEVSGTLAIPASGVP